MYEFLQPDGPVPASGLRRAINSSTRGLPIIVSGLAFDRMRCMMVCALSSSSGLVVAVMNCAIICSVASRLGLTLGPPVRVVAAAMTAPSRALRAARSSVLWSTGWSCYAASFCWLGCSGGRTLGSVSIRSAMYSRMRSSHSPLDALPRRRLWFDCVDAVRPSGQFVRIVWPVSRSVREGKKYRSSCALLASWSSLWSCSAASLRSHVSVTAA